MNKTYYTKWVLNRRLTAIEFVCFAKYLLLYISILICCLISLLLHCVILLPTRYQILCLGHWQLTKVCFSSEMGNQNSDYISNKFITMQQLSSFFRSTFLGHLPSLCLRRFHSFCFHLLWTSFQVVAFQSFGFIRNESDGTKNTQQIGSLFLCADFLFAIPEIALFFYSRFKM